MTNEESKGGTAIIESVSELRGQVREWRMAGQKIGLVPTMGALHQGHLSLIERIRPDVDRVIVSIFVNPKQFGEGEDFEKYPRDIASDAAALGQIGTDLVFAPIVTDMYPPDFATLVQINGGLQDVLCGPHRPGHFDGVTTVVAKLLNQCQPDVAIFGKKDYQQYRILSRMVTDLDLPIEVIAGDIIREDDGLAMSSRNAYLTEQERAIAGSLNVILRELRDRAREGEDVRLLEADGRRRLLENGFQMVDYLDFRDTESLDFVSDLTRPTRVLAVARIGSVRLLDNFSVC